jgi:hypothetical protein
MRLTANDRCALELCRSFHMLTVEALRARAFPGCLPNAVARRLARLCRQRLLVKHTLVHPRCYYTTGAGLGPQSLPEHLAVLDYCTCGSVPRERLTREELRTRFPWLRGEGEAVYCLEGETLLAVRVDRGAAPDHVARRCAALVNALHEIPRWHQLLAKRRFALVVLAPTADKEVAVQRALNSRSWPTGLQIRTAVIEDLFFLIASNQHAT